MIDSIAKVVATIAPKYPELELEFYHCEEWMPFLRDVVEHALLLLFSKRSLQIIYWLFVDEGETVDKESQCSDEATQNAHMHITHALNQLCPYYSSPRRIFLMYFTDTSKSNW